MDRLRENREIDISRARPRNRETQRSAAISRPSAAGASRAALAGEHRAAGSVRPRTAATHADREAAAVSNAARQEAKPSAAAKKRRKRGGQIAAIVVACVLLVIVLIGGGVYLYVDSLIQESDLGSFDDVQPPAADSGETQQSIVPPDFEGVRNILVLGLDYDDDDAVVRD